jgi:hypothetical protein
MVIKIQNLAAEDCFYIAKVCAEKYDFETAIEWLQGCEDRFNNATRNQAFRMLALYALFQGELNPSSMNPFLVAFSRDH